MPRGQYTRKPRPPVEAEMQTLADTAPERNTASLDRMMDEQPAVREALHEPAFTPMEIAYLGDVPGVAAAPEPESFDDWMEEPVPAAPNDTMVGQKVRTWAGSVCAIQHGVTWAPVADSSMIEVVLTTTHGTARMRKPAGQWTEADVDFALEAMRDDLKV